MSRPPVGYHGFLCSSLKSGLPLSDFSKTGDEKQVALPITEKFSKATPGEKKEMAKEVFMTASNEEKEKMILDTCREYNKINKAHARAQDRDEHGKAEIMEGVLGDLSSTLKTGVEHTPGMDKHPSVIKTGLEVAESVLDIISSI